MEIIPQSGLQDFLKKVESPINCVIHDTSDTHFSRAYFHIQCEGESYCFLVAGYQNFVSDYNKRRDCIEEAMSLFQKMVNDWRKDGLEIGEAQVQATGRYPLFAESTTETWWKALPKPPSFDWVKAF